MSKEDFIVFVPFVHKDQVFSVYACGVILTLQEFLEYFRDKQKLCWTYRKEFDDGNTVFFEILSEINLEEQVSGHIKNLKYRKFCNLLSNTLGIEDFTIDLFTKKTLVDYARLVEETLRTLYPLYENNPLYAQNLGLTRLFSQEYFGSFFLNGSVLEGAVESGLREIQYSCLGTKTGRLGSASQDGFNPLNIPKSQRIAIEPTSRTSFLMADFSALDINVFDKISGANLGVEDFHERNSTKVFGGVSRDESKKLFFSWFYGAKNHRYEEELGKFYNKEAVLSEYWSSSGYVTNPYGRQIISDIHHSLCYIVQSTSSDVCANALLKIEKALEGTEAKLCLSIHDAFVIDLNGEPVQKVVDLTKSVIENTLVGHIPVTYQVGDNLFEMEDV